MKGKTSHQLTAQENTMFDYNDIKDYYNGIMTHKAIQAGLYLQTETPEFIQELKNSMNK